MIRVYGVPSCKKIINTKNLLEKHKIVYEFVNVKKNSLPEAKLQSVVDQLGLEKVINSKGPTYRTLGLKDKNLTGKELFAELLKEQGMIARPLIEHNGKYHIGYDEEKILGFLQ